jgi:ribosomal protein S3AE
MVVKKKIKIGKKKKWFDIALPSSLNSEIFSQGFAETPEDLLKKNITFSLGDAISVPSKKHINLKLVITSIKTSVAHTDIKALEVNPSFLLRKSRKNSKVTAKAIGQSSDGFKVEVRLCAITNGHCISTAKREIRKQLSEYLSKVIKESRKDAIISNLVSNTIQTSIKRDIHKIFPIRSIELEKIKIL